jgi:hypothetical protein
VPTPTLSCAPLRYFAVLRLHPAWMTSAEEDTIWNKIFGGVYCGMFSR